MKAFGLAHLDPDAIVAAFVEFRPCSGIAASATAGTTRSRSARSAMRSPPAVRPGSASSSCTCWSRKATRRTAADADAAASRQGARLASVNSRISSSQSRSARQTRPTPDGSISGSASSPSPSSGRYAGSPPTPGNGPPSVTPSAPAPLARHDPRDHPAVLGRPLRRLRAPAEDGVLEVADNGERQRGQPDRHPVEQPQQAPRRRAEHVQRAGDRRRVLAACLRMPFGRQAAPRRDRARHRPDPAARRTRTALRTPGGRSRRVRARSTAGRSRGSTVRRSRRHATRRVRGARRRCRPPQAPSRPWCRRG